MDDNVIFSRVNTILQNRQRHLVLNNKAYCGGDSYIDARLWRAVNESNLSWNGTNQDGIYIPGRKERTVLVSDAARVADKIDKYIFSESAERAGADEDFTSNVTGDGVQIDTFFEQINHEITVGQWLWVQVDAPYWDVLEGRTLADRIDSGYSVRWQIWPSLSVPDWKLDVHGNLLWIITESYFNDDFNPFTPAKEYKIRTLYRLNEFGEVVVTDYMAQGEIPPEGLNLRKDFVISGLNRIPFVLVGRPSINGWWFDDVESKQASELNLGSLNQETMYNSVYPQMVVPESAVNSAEMSIREEKNYTGSDVIRLVREVIRGRNHPIVETSDEKGITRYVQPSKECIEVIRGEIESLRRTMFDNAGLALFNKETRQVQSADSKKFDHLDTESTLKNRALMLQNVEKRLVELSKMFDPSFKEWDPVYPSKFDVFNAEEASKAIQISANMPDATPMMRKMANYACIKMLQSVASFNREMVDEALKEVDNMVIDEGSGNIGF